MDDWAKRKMHKKRLRKKWLFTATIANLFLIMTLLIHAPFESYVGNASQFWFSLNDLLPAMAICAVGVFVILELLVLVLPTVAIKIITGLVFAFTLCAYLQINFLNPDYGFLGVNEIDWENPGTSAYVNAAMWSVLCVGIPAALVLIRKKIMRTIVKSVCALLCIMQLVSVASLAVANPQLFSSDENMTLTTDGLYTAGTQEGSVLVIIVDTFDNLYFDKVMEEVPELLSAFDGFVRYENSTGSYTKTGGAVPYLISGIPNDNTQTLPEHNEQAYADSALLKTLRDADYDVRFFIDTSEKYLLPYVDNVGEDSFRITDTAALYTSFMKYVGFRTMPELAKESFYLVGKDFDTLQAEVAEAAKYTINDVKFYNELVENGIQPVDEKTFQMIRLYGPHSPFTMDDNCVRVEKTTAIKQSIGSVRILQEYFDGMKAAGVYDSTSIIVLGDHSRYRNGDTVFLVKEANARGAMETSSAPVSHEDFHNTVFDLAGLPAVDYGKSALDVEATEQRTRRAWLYDEHIMWKYQPEYLPPLWEVTYGMDGAAPQYTGRIYSRGEILSFADVAVEVEWNKVYDYDYLEDFYALDSLVWGEADKRFMFMNMRQGQIFFKIPSIPEDGVNVTMTFNTWMPTSPNQLQIAAQGITVFDQTFKGKMQESISFHVPAECIDPETHLVTLDVYTPNGELTSDHRIISFGVMSIMVADGE